MKGNHAGVGIDAKGMIASSATSKKTNGAERTLATHKGQTKAITSAKRLAKKAINRIKGRIRAQITEKTLCANILIRETDAQRKTNAHFYTRLIATSEKINATKKKTGTMTKSWTMTQTTKKTANPKTKSTTEAHQAKTALKKP